MAGFVVQTATVEALELGLLACCRWATWLPVAGFGGDLTHPKLLNELPKSSGWRHALRASSPGLNPARFLIYGKSEVHLQVLAMQPYSDEASVFSYGAPKNDPEM